MKKAFLFIIFSLGLVLPVMAQQAEKGESKTRQELQSVLASKDEKLLVQAIRFGSDRTKANCIKSLAEKSSISDETLSVIKQYMGYGVTYGNRGNYLDTSWYVRKEAAWALAKLLAGKKRIDGIHAMLEVLREEPMLQVRMALIYALGKIGDARAVPALIEKVRFAREGSIVYAAIIALGEIGHPEAFAELLDMSEHGQYTKTIKRAAIEALSKIEWSNGDSSGGGTTSAPATTTTTTTGP